MRLSGKRIFLCTIVLLFLIALICTAAYLKKCGGLQEGSKRNDS